MRNYCFITILISAFLLLLIQPMLAKMLLPHVGGAPSVWIASMLFFQTTLLIGYGYAAITTHFLTPRKQWIVHLGVFALAVAVSIPLSLRLPDFQATAQPVNWVLLSLLMTVGLPYFILSASSSLLQRWYHAETGKEPYFLFSASNAGSFLGLFAYPLLIEWLLELPDQLTFFSGGFILLFVLFGGLFLWLRHQKIEKSTAVINQLLDRITAFNAVWLAFLPSALFLALTLYVTMDVGSFPFLWVVPLALYLLSFVVAFAPWGERWIYHAQKLHVLAVAIIITSLFFFIHPAVMLIHFALFFIIALSCHGQLARIRPAPEKLTAFFFWVSLGGALGGLLNVLAPLLFNDTHEYAGLVALSPLALPAKRKLQDILNLPKAERKKMGLMFAVLLLLISSLWLGTDKESAVKLLHQSRNFYGVSKVNQVKTADGLLHKYTHGTTVHGLQEMNTERSLTPASYYAPIFKLISALPNRYFTQPFGVLGLGAGTLACYGHEGQRLDFYEIDAEVIRIAQNPDLFTYLRDCPTNTRIFEGDGRLQLKAQPDSIGYHLLVIDAFTSDAIPMHLLTYEAVELYTQKLSQPDGILAFNISNRYYQLAPFLTHIANMLGWQSYHQLFKATPNSLEQSSEWLLMIPANSPWKPQLDAAGFQQMLAKDDIPLWTDNYSHILPAIKLGD